MLNPTHGKRRDYNYRKTYEILRIYATIIIIAFSNYYKKGDKFSTT
jgi:hypothetical protein